jgi:hypothetical protein
MENQTEKMNWYNKLSDQEVNKQIEELTPYQLEKFLDRRINYGNDSRLSLFIARSFGPVKMPQHE